MAGLAKKQRMANNINDGVMPARRLAPVAQRQPARRQPQQSGGVRTLSQAVQSVPPRKQSMEPSQRGEGFQNVPGSNLQMRSPSRRLMTAGPKGSNQQSQTLGISDEAVERFNRPVGPYRKVQRPGMQTSAPVGRFYGDLDTKSPAGRLSNNSMPDFYRGGSRANKSVQRRNEAKWMLDRGRGSDALALAQERGGTQVAISGAGEQGANLRAEMDSISDEQQADTLAASRLLDSNATRAQKARLARQKAYTDYKTRYLSDSDLLPEEVLTESEYFGQKKQGGNGQAVTDLFARYKQ